MKFFSILFKILQSRIHAQMNQKAAPILPSFTKGIPNLSYFLGRKFALYTRMNMVYLNMM